MHQLNTRYGTMPHDPIPHARRAPASIWRLMAAVAALAVAALPAAARGAALEVINFSFETPDPSAGGTVTDGTGPGLVGPNPPGWVHEPPTNGSSGLAVIYDPNDSAFPNASDGAAPGRSGILPSPADGFQVVAVASDASSGGEAAVNSISQILAGPNGLSGDGDDPLLQPSTRYTLTAAVGERDDVPRNPYRIQLLAGAAPTFSVLAETQGSFNAEVVDGGFITVQAEFTTPASVAPGQRLQVRLSEMPDAGGQLVFDNVRVDAEETVPEPAAFAGLCLAAGALARRRRN